ncbi:thyrostimulin beta-5 subunit-like [Tachypleus tridentatus]|uniref:thyrostimulin beta-5 subunit-like n=1 Tax=Tachypleus tridentatus TaxID=6853 RepID=UPI003FD3FE11
MFYLSALVLWLHLFSVAPITVAEIRPESTLECHKRLYTFKATRTDSKGRQCWDYLNAMSCWGRCDSGEIADWRFPYKRSYHSVCMHDEKQLRKVTLTHCDLDVEPQLRDYLFYEAVSCSCQICHSSTASCESVPYQANRAP